MAVAAGRAPRGADAEDRIAVAQLRDPRAIARQVAAAGLAHVARMGVDNADDLQSLVLLPQDAARQTQSGGVETDVDLSSARSRLGAGGQSGQGDRFSALTHAHQDPADLLRAARRHAMAGIVVEKGAGHAFAQNHALQAARRCWRRDRGRRRYLGGRRVSAVSSLSSRHHASSRSFQPVVQLGQANVHRPILTESPRRCQSR